MSLQDYTNAQKLGKKEYHACINKGKYPYLPVLDDLVKTEDIDSEENLGVDIIPLRLVIGTCTEGRTNAFADNFMPLLDSDTEFGAKWANLSDSQINEGIREPIKVYEYMNKFYVLEGNKRVSVLKYFNAITIEANVIRKIPKRSDDPDVRIYYEFMDFYKATKMNDIYFSNEGSFPILMQLVGITKDKKFDGDDKMNFVSSYLNFRNIFEAKGGDKFDYPVGDAYLRFIHIFGYDTVKNMSPKELNVNILKSWAEFELLNEDTAVDIKMDPFTPKKNILSYLLPTDSYKKKVGFIYEKSPETSEWCYAHELGRQYIEDTFNDKIETIKICNVKPNEEDADAIESLISDGAEIIFVTSPAMIMACVKEAIAHPDVKILNCSLNASHKYIRTYYGRMYEAKMLSGMIAGALCTNGRIGYVAKNPVFGEMSNINAFAYGAKMVNPDIKIYLDWTCKIDNDIESNLKNKNIDIVSYQDMIVPKDRSRRFGLCRISDHGTKHIAMTVWHWGVFYEKLIQSIIGGSWNKDASSSPGKALNYWWGLSSDAIDLIISNSVASETVGLVNIVRDAIEKGTITPFMGIMHSQNGKIYNKECKKLSHEEIITMDWLLDNVVGDIPDISQIDDVITPLIETQGIIDK